MRIYNGGETVGKGTYWSPVDGREIIVREELALPGDVDIKYLRVPRGGLLLIAPVFGLMYVFFLPLFGVGTFLAAWFAAIVGTVVAVALTGIKVCSGIVSKSVSFGWTPSSTYLAGKKRRARQIRSSEDKAGQNVRGKEA